MYTHIAPSLASVFRTYEYIYIRSATNGLAILKAAKHTEQLYEYTEQRTQNSCMNTQNSTHRTAV